MNFKGLLDMFDGGGAGMSGDKFKGGPLSGLLNMLGIDPLGAGKAMDSSPMPRPRPPGGAMAMSAMGGASPPSPAAPQPPNQPFMMQGGPITSSPLGPIGSMSDEQLMALLRKALSQAPSASGYGPR